MYVRMTFFKTKPGKLDELRNIYVNEVIPLHKGHKGIRFVHLLECIESPDEGISITAWDSKGDREAYEKSGDYGKIVARFEDLLEGDPTLKSYEVTASSEPLILRYFEWSETRYYSLQGGVAMKVYDCVPGLEFEEKDDLQQSPAWFLGRHPLRSSLDPHVRLVLGQFLPPRHAVRRRGPPDPHHQGLGLALQGRRRLSHHNSR